MKVRFLAAGWLLVIIMSTLLSACTPSANEPEQVAGGYTDDRAITDEDMEIFNKATAENVGVTLEPSLVATQVVSGTNYRFTATSTPVSPDAESKQVYVYIYVPLDGEPELTEIVDIQ